MADSKTPNGKLAGEEKRWLPRSPPFPPALAPGPRALGGLAPALSAGHRVHDIWKPALAKLWSHLTKVCKRAP